MKNEVIVLEYQLGNIHSVLNACAQVGLDAKVSSNPEEIMAAKALILPGVGSFGDAMNALRSQNLDKVIVDYSKSNRPIMGVCLGMQLLFSESEEFGTHKGLDLIKGKVLKFPKVVNSKKIKIPHMGWNQIYSQNSWANSPYQNLKNKEFVYFVHSYYVEPEDENVILSLTNYEDFEYCSSVKSENIFATQFHPEKSGKAGLQIYKTWKEIIFQE